MKKWLQRLGLRSDRPSGGAAAASVPPPGAIEDSTEDARLERAERLLREGNALEAQRLQADAESRYRDAIQAYPEGAGIRIHLGNLLFDLARLEEAEDCYEQALALNPGSAGAMFSLARIRIEQARFPEASRLLDAAIAADPAFAPALLSHGLVCERLGDLPRAVVRYEQAIALRPRDRNALMGLAMAHWNLGHLQEAYDAVLRVLAVAPDDAEGWPLRGQLEVKFGLIPEAIASLRRTVELNPDRPEFLSMLLFNLNYLPGIGPAELLREHRKFDERFGTRETLASAFRSGTADRDRRLKVGYVSGDFRGHVVARFLEPVLAHHDAARVEVFAYHTGSDEDATTLRLKDRVHHWRNVSGVSDDEAAGLIAGDRIDILVDLSGHTAHHRLAVFARRPAPIQATWLGYPGTTGLSAMDYRICDRYTDPPGASERWSSERPARMPASQWCLPLAGELPPVNALPMDRNGYVTFGSFNNVAKLNDGVVDVWAALLRELPAAKLIFFRVPARAAEDRLARLLGERGIGRDRFELRGYCELALYPRGYHDVDIALDPFPYNGYTTSFDALAMGVPFVALVGEGPCARGSLSILANVGLADLATDTPERYVAVARTLASDLVRLRSLRAGMRQRLAESPLGDVGRFTRDLEDLYRTWWHDWCDGRHFDQPGPSRAALD